MRWKPEPLDVDSQTEVCENDSTLRHQIRDDLRARGVAAPAAEVLAERVGREVDPDRNGYSAVLDGVALGFRAQSAISAELAQSATELQEIERLMTSFAGELSKLDEVLEVLAAYLRRMRTAAPASDSRLLH